jgi:integrase/recombinase XerD
MSATSSNQTVSREVERFSAYLKAEKRSENTVRQYGETLDEFLQWLKKPVEDLTKADLQKWKLYLSEEKGYCENTMSTKIAAVNQFIERVLERPDMKIRPPRRVFRTKIPLTEDEVSRMLAEAKEPRRGRKGFRNNSDMSLRDHAAICVMYYGGLRASEVVNLRKSDLDLDNKKLRVNEGKGMDFSPVNLPEEAIKSLRKYLEHGRPIPAKPEYADVVFLSSTGTPIGRAKLWPIVKRIAFRAGIEKRVSPHIFRHSLITHMAEKGLSASFIQAQSRHKSLDMVQRYTHLSQKSVREAYDSVFSKKETRETEKSAQKQSESAEKPITECLDRREKALELFLDGEISHGELEKLLSRLDGPQYRGIAPSPMNGYA